MGQYYVATILTENGNYIRTWISSFNYNSGMKLVEHSYCDNPFVIAVENLISLNGMFYKSRLLWAGDYADNEVGLDKTIYQLCNEDTSKLSTPNANYKYKFIVNHTKRLYIDKRLLKNEIHPLPLLVSEGNGRGGGDYIGPYKELCGTWARDVISMDNNMPDGYAQFRPEFS